ncbi:MAG: non-homologous end-joining DNA ligase [Candidatus Binatia bacterium]
MYARTVQQLPERDAWTYEVKFDGYRALAGRDSTGVTLWSRRGNVFTDQFPGIAKACEHLPADTLLDGEIVALDKDGRISFNLLQRHRSAAQAILFYAFDVIIHRGKSLVKVPLEMRREILGEIIGDLKNRAPLICLSDTIDAPLVEFIPLIKEFGFEGIIAKRKESCYESGKRSGAWLKYKVNKGQEFVIGGYTPGNPFDALIVGYYEGDKLLFVSKVRNGFVPQLRREVWSRLKGLQTDACPFSNLPEKKRTQWALTREEMKNCVWLKPKMVAQFEFTEWTPDGHLRQSKFTSLREDKDPREVVRESATG